MVLKDRARCAVENVGIWWPFLIQTKIAEMRSSRHFAQTTAAFDLNDAPREGGNFVVKLQKN